MNCFYHPEIVAVAHCSTCGKCLCKSCADKYTPVLCEECAAVAQAEFIKEKKTQNLKTLLLVIGGIFCFFFCAGTEDTNLFTCLWCACTPWGAVFLWNLITRNINILGSFMFWLIFMFLCIVLGGLLGGFIVIYNLGKKLYQRYA